jgi:hypothetical protein
MRYIITYENFKPIKINSEKPFKVKKHLDKNIKYLQKGIRSLKKRKWDQTDAVKSSHMNDDLNKKMKKLRDLNFKKVKQIDHFRRNPIKESLDEEDDKTLLSVLTSPDFKPEDIFNYIGLDEDDYELDYEYERFSSEKHPVFYKDKLEFNFKLSELEKLMDVDYGVIDWMMRLIGYGSDGYHSEVDDNELNYLFGYLNDDNKELIKKFADFYDYNKDITKKGKIRKLFNKLGLDKYLDSFKSEIENANSIAVDNSIKDLIRSLPFNISYHNGEFNIEIEFKYTKLIKYLEDNESKVKTIKELFENIPNSDEFSYEINEYEIDNIDYTSLNTEVYNDVIKFINFPDEIFPNLIKANNLDLIQNKIDLAMFSYYYHLDPYKPERYNLFQIANQHDNSVLEWFRTEEFEKIIIERDEDSEIEAYHEFIYNGNIAKYNI